jgi:hypothetical protein
VVTPTPSPERALARRLLAREAGAHQAPGETVAAADGVLRQLHAHLAGWLGSDGSQAILARALDRTRVGHAALAGASLDVRGEPLLAVRTEHAGDRDPAEVTDAVVTLIATALALVTRFIGADLLARLLEQAWPNETFGDVQPGVAQTAPRSARDEAPVTGPARDASTPSEDASSA